MKNEFQPTIVAFLCNWCSYAGADLAGLSRFQYPPSVRIIRVMCSGRVDPIFVLKSLEEGADGVLVGGCHIGDCHYISGNLQTQERMQNLIKVLDVIGFSDRLRLEWVSAGEGQKFQQVIIDFTKKIKELGPSPFKKGNGGVEANRGK
ncbi:MAG: hydrogenase iron-sulfur subunit [Candidatus Lokiarchaeota archaeon]|nr:hydrogenase iron-sulfur subunit [Candidatus Lokiarchaeota archaeon]